MDFKNSTSQSIDLLQEPTTSQDFTSISNDDWQYFDANVPDQQQNFHIDLTGKDDMMGNSGLSTFTTSNGFDNSDHYQVINCKTLTAVYERSMYNISL